MIDLFNFETKKLEPVAEEDVPGYILSKKYGFRRGSEVPVKASDGSLWMLPAEKAGDAFRLKATYPTLREREDVYYRNKYGSGWDNFALAAGFSAVRGWSGGASDLIFSKSGVNPRAISALEQTHPGTSAVVEVGTMLAGGLTARAGQGFLTKLAQGAGGLGARAGFAAEKVTRKSIQAVAGRGVVSKVLQGVTPIGAAGSIDAALLGVGGAISEAALNEEPVTSEKLLAAAKLSAIWGFAGAAGISGLALGTAKGKQLLAKGFRGAYERSMKTKAAGALGERYAEKAARFDETRAGIVKGEYKKVIGPEAELGVPYRDPSERMQASLDDAIKRIGPIANDVLEDAGKFGGELGGGLKPEVINRHINRENIAVQMRHVDSTLDGILYGGDELGIGLRDMVQNPAIYGAQGEVKKIFNAVRKLKAELVFAVENGAPGVVGRASVRLRNVTNVPADLSTRMFFALDDIKRTMQNLTKKSRGGDVLARASSRDIGAMSTRIKRSLESSDVWGEAGTIQRKLNLALHTHNTARTNFVKKFTEKLGVVGGFPRPQVTSNKVETLLKKVTNPGADTQYQIFKGLKEQNDELLRFVRNEQGTYQFDLPDNMSRLEANNRAFGELFDEFEQDAIAYNQFKDAIGSGLGSAEQAGAVGHLGRYGLAYGVGGLPGAAVYRAYEVANRVFSSTNTIAHMTAKVQRITSNIESKANRAISRMVSGRAAPGVVAAPSKLTSFLAPFAAKKGLKKKSREEQAKAIGEGVVSLAGDLDRQNQILDRVFGDVSTAAPQTTDKLRNKAVEAIRYLASIAPKRKRVPLNMYTPLRPSSLTERDVDAFAQALDALENPLGILDDLHDGTLTRRKIDAVKQVYPVLYGEMLASVIRGIGEHKGELRYEDRVHLSILFGVPFDASMSHEVVQALQKQHIPQEPQQAAGVPGRMGQLKGASRMKTQLSRVSE